MTVGCDKLDRTGAIQIGKRPVFALAIAIADVAAILPFFRYDVLGLFKEGVACLSLGVPDRLCNSLQGSSLPHSLVFAGVILGAIMVIGLYDPRPLIARLGQNRRPHWWLAVNLAGVALFLSPYLLAAGGWPLSGIAPKAPWLLVFGGLMAGSGLLLWLSSFRELAGVLTPYHCLVGGAIALVPFGVTELQKIGWNLEALQSATLSTTAFFLRIMGQNAVTHPEQGLISIGDFRVLVLHQCSGLSGVAMVSTVMSGYILAYRKRLWIQRALLLIALAATLSWLLNGARIAALLTIGANVSPNLALEGFHGYAGWLIFCALSALMLLAAENIPWIHRDRRPAALAVPVVNDPVVAEIVPFIVLLLSSLLTGAAFTEPESGYPLRFALMAAAVIVFRRAYRFEIGRFEAVPILAGALVAIVWLWVKAGGSPQPLTDVLGPVAPGTALLWTSIRLAGTVMLVPFIEEIFFRGYLLRALDFGGITGKVTALAASSVLFGALHANIWLAAASGLVFGLVTLRTGRILDAVAAHAAANAGIAAWVLWTGDWSLI